MALSESREKELALIGARARLLDIRREVEELSAFIGETTDTIGSSTRTLSEALTGFMSLDGSEKPTKPSGAKKTSWTPAARAAVAKRMKAYWAKRRGETTAAAQKPTKRRKLSAAARKSISDAQKARWAAVRANKAA